MGFPRFLLIAASVLFPVLAARAYAADPLLMIQRFAEAPIDAGLSPFGVKKDCAVLLMNVIQEQVRFGGAFRLAGGNSLALLRQSDNAALTRMIEAGTLSVDEGRYYRSTSQAMDPRQSTYVDQLEEVPDGVVEAGIELIAGRRYRRVAVLRTVSAQEITAVSDGRVTKTRFHPLPFQLEFPDFWARISEKFKDRLMFEDGRAATWKPGAFRHNRMLVALIALRESLLHFSLDEVLRNRDVLERAVIFTHATTKKNADTLRSYGYQSEGFPIPGQPHEVFSITLGQQLKYFPLEKHLPQLLELQPDRYENVLEILKRHEDGFGYRRRYLQSTRGDVVEIQDRSILSFHHFYPKGHPFREDGFQLYSLAQESIQKGQLPYEWAVAAEVPLPELKESRLWWSDKNCKPAGPLDCTLSERMRGLFQAHDWAVTSFREYANAEGWDAASVEEIFDRRLGELNFLSVAFSGMSRNELSKAGIDILSEGKSGQRVVRLKSLDIERLKVAYPDAANEARRNPVSIGVLDFQKRLLYPALTPGLSL